VLTVPVHLLAKLEDGQSEESLSEAIVTVGLPNVRHNIGDVERVT